MFFFADTEYLAFAETYEADNLAKVKDVGAKSHQEQLLLDLEKRAKEKKEAEAILTPLIQSIVDSRSVSFTSVLKATECKGA